MRRESATLHSVYLITAVIVGAAAVFYAQLIALIQGFYFQCYLAHPVMVCVFCPLLFVGATGLVVLLAPQAKGSGIPQVLQAIDYSQGRSQSRSSGHDDLVSVRTAVVKVFSMAVGILGGASIGREGPTVQISASLFALTGKRMKRIFPNVDFHSYLIAGGAAGVAAAFNAPLAGITFALEEIAHGAFDQFKDWVMLSVVIAGVAAQAIAGDYLYFGHPHTHATSLFTIILEAILIGSIGGLLGGMFARSIAYQIFAKFLPKQWWLRAFLCGCICSVLIYASNGDAAGSGYEVIRKFMDSDSTGTLPLFFPVFKFFITIFSYLSGMAGGFFAPCLSIGSGIGFTLSSLCHFINPKACALFGMVAFFSGVVRAPLTSVVIVMEMTDEHILILPFFCAAYIAQMVSRWVMPVSLYEYLAFGDRSKAHATSTRGSEVPESS
jgi:H+/Cl- antiporter ClcA